MKKYIVAIDQSTSASKLFLVDDQGEIVRRFSKAHEQFYPASGHAEHDAGEIWRNVVEGIAAVTEGLDGQDIAALAVSNQRETTVFWHRATGEPVHPAIVWQDVRSDALAADLLAAGHGEAVLQASGLMLSPYYSAAKAAHALKNSQQLRDMAREGTLCLGTVDSYLIYRLTGGQSFLTDVSNASRTQLMNLASLSWDDELLRIFGIARDCLADIRPSDGDYGVTSAEGIPRGVPITGVMGDSHAALFGHGCLTPGMAKASYGTGSSVMMNIGEAPLRSKNGLSTSVGFGFGGSTCYVLEGNVTCSGDTLVWLRDQAQMIDDIGDVEGIARSVESTGGVYLVPAFSGLGAPYFDANARATLSGMNRGTTRAHIVRAALESMAYQDADILAAMERDTGGPLRQLRVDGGGASNSLLVGFQADLLGCEVCAAHHSELSALGVAYMAGIKAGLYKNMSSIPSAQKGGTAYAPQMTKEQRGDALKGWQAAVARCRNG